MSNMSGEVKEISIAETEKRVVRTMYDGQEVD